MNDRPIPFNRPCLVGNELRYIADAISAEHVSGDGPYTRKCHALLEEALGAAKVLLTTSCTHALEMAALLLEVGPGGEVIVPSFTFPSTVNAFVLRGARPVFADIRPDTLNLDETQLEALITPRTKAVVVVHYAGVGCEMDAILEIAARRDIAVVEDNAHGFLGKYRGRHLGTFGCLAAQSFHETKNVSCGEGGALVVNDARLIERAEVIREKGTDRSRFFRGQIDKYSWIDVGSSYLPSDILAAFLYAQLEARAEIQARRRRIWKGYRDSLSGWAERHGIELPHTPAHCEHPYHLFYALLPSLGARQEFIAHLKARGIMSVFHYLPLHLSRMGRRFGGREGACPVAEQITDRIVRFPFYNDLSDDDLERVIDAATGFVPA
jgi:dTDP-4-amino-4,6-dideoxygalactose transaminase